MSTRQEQDLWYTFLVLVALIVGWLVAVHYFPVRTNAIWYVVIQTIGNVILAIWLSIPGYLLLALMIVVPVLIVGVPAFILFRGIYRSIA